MPSRPAVIIEAAINGATTKATNPSVPISPEEIAADALECLEAGAAIIHTHCNPVGGPDDEVAERYLAGFRPVWEKRPDALLYPTINFGAGALSFGHLRPMAEHGLRIGLLDPGSLNLGRRGADGLPTGAYVYANSYDRIGEILALHDELRLGPSLAIYEPGFMRATLEFHRAGRLPAGAMVKLYLSTERGLTGVPFGLPPTATGLNAYLEMMEGTHLPWAVSAVGGDLGRHEIAAMALERGGNLHLGLEFYGGDRQPTNLELVQEAVELCRRSGYDIANSDQAAEILNLPRRQRARAYGADMDG